MTKIAFLEIVSDLQLLEKIKAQQLNYHELHTICDNK